jgi:glutamyl/glutaminyl-tRNA synthetase
MYKHLGWEYPQAIHYGRLKITGAFLSKSKIVAGVKSGEFSGWDDPRLATFAALRKRGITPEAIKKMIIEVGPRPQDATLSWENLYSYNRKLLDPPPTATSSSPNPPNSPLKVSQKLPSQTASASRETRKRQPRLHRGARRGRKCRGVLDNQKRRPKP